jgi:hypothetical protein
MTNDTAVTNTIENRIFTIRGQKVMLDRDLAELYGVELKALNQAAKRNIELFPADFMFQLTKDEWDNLRSQIATAKQDISKIRYMPYVFTEHGVLLMLHIENNDYKFLEYDETIRQIIHALNNLLEKPSKTRKIGFNADE